VEAIDPSALAVLRLGAYQVLFTRVPPHAAVGETVSLAAPRHRGFINAILRTLVRMPPEHPTGDDDRSVSIRTGLSEWAVGELRRLLPVSEVEPAAAALASPAELSIRTNPCAVDADIVHEAFVAKGLPVRRGRHHPGVLHVRGAWPEALPGYGEGWFAVQDEASAVVAAAVEVRPGERVLDVCAGPGGKATDMACAARAGDKGFAVAADVSLPRVRLVRRTASRLRVTPALLVQEARRPALAGNSFDAVLVDAPCSGLGAARRRPELLWRRRREERAGLARLQVAILSGVAPLVRPGGRIVYSVCTFPRAETDAAIRAFLAKCPGFEPAQVPGPDGRSGSHRLWPHLHGTDGMFFAGFVRVRGLESG
jgi:16S rRNA (cytosine967-C5)-methyltransferase